MSVNTKHVKCAGGIVINKNKEVAVVNQNHDSWSLPKGHIDPGESNLETAKREIYEETGIIDLKLIYSGGTILSETQQCKYLTTNKFTFRKFILHPPSRFIQGRKYSLHIIYYCKKIVNIFMNKFCLYNTLYKTI